MSISDSHHIVLPRNRDRPPSKQWPEVIVRIIHKTLHKIASILFQALGDAAFSFQFEGSEMVSCNAMISAISQVKGDLCVDIKLHDII